MSRDRTWALRWSYFFLTLFAIFCAGAADLHDHHLAEEQRGDFGGNQPVVGVSPDAVELQGAAGLEPVPALLLEFGDGVGLRGGADHADQRTRGVRAVAHEVLGSATLATGVFLTYLIPDSLLFLPLFKMFAVIGEYTGIQLIKNGTCCCSSIRP